MQSQAWGGLTSVHLANTRPEGGGVADLAWVMHRLKQDYFVNNPNSKQTKAAGSHPIVILDIPSHQACQNMSQLAKILGMMERDTKVTN